MPPPLIEIAPRPGSRGRTMNGKPSPGRPSSSGGGGRYPSGPQAHSHRQLDEAINEVVRDMGGHSRHTYSRGAAHDDRSRRGDPRRSGQFHGSPPSHSSRSRHQGSPRDNYGSPRDNYGSPRDNYGPSRYSRGKDEYIREESRHRDPYHRDDRRRDDRDDRDYDRGRGNDRSRSGRGRGHPRDHRDQEPRTGRRRKNEPLSPTTQNTQYTEFTVSEYMAMPSESESDQGGFFTCGADNDSQSSYSEIEPPSKTRHTRYPQGGQELQSVRKVASYGSELAKEEPPIWSDETFFVTKQEHSYMSITVTAVQLLILLTQMAMCGMAPFDVNPMIGPYPDAFSDWGAKNAYLFMNKEEYWRLITPAFLHVGVVHLLGNAMCLFYTAALFERDWGSWTWVVIFIMSELGCTSISMAADPETIGVGSSGALMGLFAAKLAEVLTYTLFTLSRPAEDDSIQIDQLGNVLCGLTLLSIFSSVTYVDWSGHMGGLAVGFLTGMVLFSGPIQNPCVRFLWGSLGLVGLGLCVYGIFEMLTTQITLDKDLGDACQYFRNLYPEGRDCGCW